METFQQWLPKLVQVTTESRVLGAVIIMVAALIAAKVIDVFIDRVVLALARKSKFRLDDAILGVVHRPVWISILLVGALSAVRWVGPGPCRYHHSFLAEGRPRHSPFWTGGWGNREFILTGCALFCIEKQRSL
jgi:hypothetical protein